MDSLVLYFILYTSFDTLCMVTAYRLRGTSNVRIALGNVDSEASVYKLKIVKFVRPAQISSKASWPPKL